MELTLSDIYLYSDFDGTLHSSINHNFPPCNIEALQRFVAKGGHFGLATGRGPVSAKIYTEILPINAPCICLNGGAAYDMCKDEYLYADFLPKTAEGYTRSLLAAYPHWDAAVVTKECYHYVGDPARSLGRMDTRSYAQNPHFEKPIPEDWLKVVFNTRDGEAKVFMDALNPENYPGVTFVTSDTFFVEMLPFGTSKGKALEAICQVLGLQIEQTAAIGDYYNDLEMLTTAGHSACVAGAPQEVQEAAKMVLCSCEEGAVARFIEHLESLYER